MKILTLSAHPSEFEFAIISTSHHETLVSGRVKDIGNDNSYIEFEKSNQPPIRIRKIFYDYKDSLKELMKWLTDDQYGVLTKVENLKCIAHRVVFCANCETSPMLINARVLKIIEEGIALAPLHNNSNLMLIKAALSLFELPQLAVFDNYFYQSLLPVNYLYALPQSLNEQYHIRKYGFHGLHHLENLQKSCRLLNKPQTEINLISCCIERGISVVAIKDGIAIDTNCGFGTFSGIPSIDHAGDFDPAVILYLLEQKLLGLDDIKYMVYHQSGINAIIKKQMTFDELIETSLQQNAEALFALDYLCSRIAKSISGMLINYSSLDAICFSGINGAKYPLLREQICKKLSLFSVSLDGKLNDKNKPDSIISDRESKYPIYLFRNQLFLMMAKTVSTVSLKAGSR